MRSLVLEGHKYNPLKRQYASAFEPNFNGTCDSISGDAANCLSNLPENFNFPGSNIYFLKAALLAAYS